MDDLSSFCCLNPGCADQGKRGHGNLTVTARYGPSQSRRMLRCRTCTARFSERKGTPLFDARLPPGKVRHVLAHVAEGIGTRKTARLTGVHTDNFCWPVRTLRVKGEDGRHQPRTPAMAAGLTDRVWALSEWLNYPAVQRK
ncbi:Marine sediment metagenome DNA, contig: S01H1_L04904 OS=marine sediment metagenome GN=S01H1_13053 PE=4 SV=1 [Gemmata massiliana]|uniref:Marine sediment metagenome DNA, contig: S01H1_L04904 n=1 Tax=Gemmata massiliana TaxID=1210884 RepID=A0A6P2D7J8_9BACT|nr:hypothetical protein [Gemmata massiliana]VTR97311.1 Marine sediment metagenome DNA, contig: S01H1_L04904 OS=marine sediment metagenome GN=S01H1_13053 PE=4 SV=1 [Gemmata massiliana]